MAARRSNAVGKGATKRRATLGATSGVYARDALKLPPKPPRRLTWVGADSSSVEVTWRPPHARRGQAATARGYDASVTHYGLQYAPKLFERWINGPVIRVPGAPLDMVGEGEDAAAQGGFVVGVAVPPPARSGRLGLVVDGLQPASPYVVRVRARTSWGWGYYTPPLECWTRDESGQLPPTAPRLARSRGVSSATSVASGFTGSSDGDRRAGDGGGEDPFGADPLEASPAARLRRARASSSGSGSGGAGISCERCGNSLERAGRCGAMIQESAPEPARPTGGADDAGALTVDTSPAPHGEPCSCDGYMPPVDGSETGDAAARCAACTHEMRVHKTGRGCVCEQCERMLCEPCGSFELQMVGTSAPDSVASGGFGGSSSVAGSASRHSRDGSGVTLESVDAATAGEPAEGDANVDAEFDRESPSLSNRSITSLDTAPPVTIRVCEDCFVAAAVMAEADSSGGTPGGSGGAGGDGDVWVPAPTQRLSDSATPASARLAGLFGSPPGTPATADARSSPGGRASARRAYLTPQVSAHLEARETSSLSPLAQGVRDDFRRSSSLVEFLNTMRRHRYSIAAEPLGFVRENATPHSGDSDADDATGGDAGADAGANAGADASADAGGDAGGDAGADGGADAGADAAASCEAGASAAGAAGADKGGKGDGAATPQPSGAASPAAAASPAVLSPGASAVLSPGAPDPTERVLALSDALGVPPVPGVDKRRRLRKSRTASTNLLVRRGSGRIRVSVDGAHQAWLQSSQTPDATAGRRHHFPHLEDGDDESGTASLAGGSVVADDAASFVTATTDTDALSVATREAFDARAAAPAEPPEPPGAESSTIATTRLPPASAVPRRAQGAPRRRSSSFGDLTDPGVVQTLCRPDAMFAWLRRPMTFAAEGREATFALEASTALHAAARQRHHALTSGDLSELGEPVPDSPGSSVDDSGSDGGDDRRDAEDAGEAAAAGVSMRGEAVAGVSMRGEAVAGAALRREGPQATLAPTLRRTRSGPDLHGSTLLSPPHRANDQAMMDLLREPSVTLRVVATYAFPVHLGDAAESVVLRGPGAERELGAAAARGTAAATTTTTATTTIGGSSGSGSGGDGVATAEQRTFPMGSRENYVEFDAMVRFALTNACRTVAPPGPEDGVEAGVAAAVEAVEAAMPAALNDVVGTLMNQVVLACSRTESSGDAHVRLHEIFGENAQVGLMLRHLQPNLWKESGVDTTGLPPPLLVVMGEGGDAARIAVQTLDIYEVKDVMDLEGDVWSFILSGVVQHWRLEPQTTLEALLRDGSLQRSFAAARDDAARSRVALRAARRLVPRFVDLGRELAIGTVGKTPGFVSVQVLGLLVRAHTRCLLLLPLLLLLLLLSLRMVADSLSVRACRTLTCLRSGRSGTRRWRSCTW